MLHYCRLWHIPGDEYEPRSFVPLAIGALRPVGKHIRWIKNVLHTMHYERLALSLDGHDPLVYTSRPTLSADVLLPAVWRPRLGGPSVGLR